MDCPFFSLTNMLIFLFSADSPEETGEVVHDLISLHDSEDEGSPIIQEDDPTPPKRKSSIKPTPVSTAQAQKKGQRAAAKSPVKATSHVHVEGPIPPSTPVSRASRQTKKGKGKKRQASPSPIDSVPQSLAITRLELERQVPEIDVDLLPFIGKSTTAKSSVSHQCFC
jgi:hypothetical protein